MKPASKPRLARRLAYAGLLLAGLLTTGCPKETEVITKTGDDVPKADVDADPIALLPSGAVGMVVIDAKAFYASEFGQNLERIVSQRAPVPPAAGFDVKRDLETLYIGVYSMSGLDMAAAATGTFNAAAIEAAADGVTDTPLGAPLVKQSYAGRNLYVSRNVGFSILSQRTAVFGNETGIRRVLDRISDGLVKRSVPSYMGDLLSAGAGTPSGAPIALGFDLKDQDVVSSAVAQFPFLDGIQSARAIGNFESPGMHLAGTSVYETEEKAKAGTESLLSMSQLLQSVSWLTGLLGISNPVQKLEAQAEGKESKFVAAIDGVALSALLDKFGGFLGVPPQPKVIKATTSPGVVDETAPKAKQ